MATVPDPYSMSRRKASRPLGDQLFIPRGGAKWLGLPTSAPVKNRPVGKPSGGFWTSTYRGPLERSDWATFADQNLDPVRGEGVILEPGGKVYWMETQEDYDWLQSKFPRENQFGDPLIDWEALARSGRWDGVHVSRKGLRNLAQMSPGNFDPPLYGWDVESTVWLNPSTLKVKGTAKLGSAARVAARFAVNVCNPNVTGALWVDPAGKAHKLRGGQTHGAWATEYVQAKGQVAEAEKFNSYASYLLYEGWIRVANFLNVTIGGKPSERAKRATAEVILGCILKRRDVDPEEDTLWVEGPNFQDWTPTLVDFIQDWGGRDLEDKLFAGLMARTAAASRGICQTEHGYAWVEPNGKVHLLNQTHYGWAIDYLDSHPGLVKEWGWGGGISAFTSRGWIRVANATNLSTGPESVVTAKAWKAVADLQLECVQKGYLTPEDTVHLDMDDRPFRFTVADFAGRFVSRSQEEKVWEAALTRVSAARVAGFAEEKARILEWVDSHTQGDKVRLYREIIVPPGGIRTDKLGIFWTPEKSKAHSPYGVLDEAKGEPVILEVLAPRSGVDEVATVATFRRYPGEREIRLLPGTRVQVVGPAEARGMGKTARQDLGSFGDTTVKYKVRQSTSDGIVLWFYVGRKRVGHMVGYWDFWSGERSRWPCTPEMLALVERYPAVESKVMKVGTSHLDPDFHGQGIGKAMYEALMAEAFKVKGAHMMVPTSCTIGSGTSNDAQRVWQSLTRRFPSEGSVVAVLGQP